MPTKFKKDGLEWTGGGPFSRNKQAVKKKYFIKNTPKQELIDYINNENGKPKIKQKSLKFSPRVKKTQGAKKEDQTLDF